MWRDGRCPPPHPARVRWELRACAALLGSALLPAGLASLGLGFPTCGPSFTAVLGLITRPLGFVHILQHLEGRAVFLVGRGKRSPGGL